MLQIFTLTILHSTRIFVWFKNNKGSELLSFYCKLGFHPAHSTCYSFEHTFSPTIITAINNIESLEYLLERNKIKYPENIEYKPKILYPCELCGYKLQLNIFCKYKMSKTKIAMSYGGKGKNDAQPNICKICLCRTCNTQFGVNVYSNHYIFHPNDENKVNHYNKTNKIQEI